MANVRKTYDLPDRTPLPHRQWALMLLVPVVALLLWLALPDSAAGVAVLFVVLVTLVFVGVGRVLSSRAVREAPKRTVPREPSQL